MDPITLLLASMLAAAAADQEEKAALARRRAPPGTSPPPPADPEATHEAMELLGEVWPPSLTPLDWAWMELMDAYGTPVHPWTPEQIVAFHQGELICPLGHHVESGFFRYLDMDLVMSKLEPSHEPDSIVLDQQNPGRDLGVVHGLVQCKHPDHSDGNQVFWFPFSDLELNYR